MNLAFKNIDIPVLATICKIFRPVKLTNIIKQIKM